MCNLLTAFNSFGAKHYSIRNGVLISLLILLLHMRRQQVWPSNSAKATLIISWQINLFVSTYKMKRHLAQGVSRSERVNSSFTCYLIDESRPLIHAVQAECINRFMLLESKVVVVSDEEKVV